MSTSIININNVSFSYNGESVLQNINLDVLQGDFIAIIGPNGGGKTTLLKLILGLLKPDKGVIHVMGKPAMQAAPNIGYVPQNVHVNRNFPITVMDVALMGMQTPKKPWGRKSPSPQKEAMAVLERLEIPHVEQ